MMIERAARGYLPVDQISEAPKRSEFEEFWALRTPKLFFQSLSMPMGARMAMERAARKIEDPSDMPRSEFMEYWAPRTFEASSIQTKAEYDKVAKGPYGKLMEAERKALGYLEVS